MKKLLLLVFSIFAVTGYIIGCANHLLASPRPEGRVVWELTRDDKHFIDKHYPGQVLRGAVDAERQITYLATRAGLYAIQMEEGRPKVQHILEKHLGKGERLVLAPGGGVYASLIPHPSSRGLFSARLFNIRRNQIGGMTELSPREPPDGFSALYLGFQGKLIVTETPLDDWEGIRGRFKFTFWKRDGSMLYAVDLNGRHTAILGPSGEAILLLGDKEALAYSPERKEPRRYSGKFGKAAIVKSESGSIALLNPSSPEEIRQVQIFRSSSEPVKIQLPTPVHRLTLAPDGSSAVVIGDQGRYFYLDPRAGTWREGKRLPFDDSFYIFDSKFVDSRTLALAVQHRTPKATWEKPTIIIIDQNGNPLFQREFQIRQATSSIPRIDVTFRSRFIVGFTEDTAILIELKE